MTEDFFVYSYLMGASCGGDILDESVTTIQSFQHVGLEPQHAYSVLDVQQVNEHRCVYYLIRRNFRAEPHLREIARKLIRSKNFKFNIFRILVRMRYIIMKCFCLHWR